MATASPFEIRGAKCEGSIARTRRRRRAARRRRDRQQTRRSEAQRMVRARPAAQFFGHPPTRSPRGMQERDPGIYTNEHKYSGISSHTQQLQAGPDRRIRTRTVGSGPSRRLRQTVRARVETSSTGANRGKVTRQGTISVCEMAGSTGSNGAGMMLAWEVDGEG